MPTLCRGGQWCVSEGKGHLLDRQSLQLLVPPPCPLPQGEVPKGPREGTVPTTGVAEGLPGTGHLAGTQCPHPSGCALS